MSSNSRPETAASNPAAPPARATWSIAGRLTIWYGATSFAFVASTTLFLWTLLLHSLDRAADRLLTDKVHILGHLLSDGGNEAGLTQEIAGDPVASRYAPVFMRVLGPDAALVAESPGMGAVLRPDVFGPPVAAGDGPMVGRDARSPDGRLFRVVSAVVPRNGGSARGGFQLQVAVDRTHERDVLRFYRRPMWLFLGCGLAVSCAAGLALGRRGVKRIWEIAAAAQRVRSSTLNEKIPCEGLPAETLALATTFNEMLVRLEESFQRLSQFSADIAHELRTPLTNLRGGLEVTLGRPRSEEEYRDSIVSALEECARLTRLVDTLLFLARADSPEMQIHKEPVDIAAKLDKVRELYESEAQEKGISLKTECPPGLTARVERMLLQRAVANLVSNAIDHTPRGGEVAIRGSRHEGRLRIEVSDTGCGIPREDIPKVFDRFYRADAVRTGDSGHLGLGMAIVKSIAALHGGTVGVESTPGRGTRVYLDLPEEEPSVAPAPSGPAC